jgi:hypothetical protein
LNRAEPNGDREQRAQQSVEAIEEVGAKKVAI